FEDAGHNRFELGRGEALGAGRSAEGDAGEMDQGDQLVGAGLDEAHGLLAHILGGGILEQVEAGDDGPRRADEVVAQLARHQGGEIGAVDRRGPVVGGFGLGVWRHGCHSLGLRRLRQTDLICRFVKTRGSAISPGVTDLLSRHLKSDALGERLSAIAEEAAALILPYWRAGGAVDTKADDSPVTEADRAAERLILERLGDLYPGVQTVAEESACADGLPAEVDRRFF